MSKRDWMCEWHEDWAADFAHEHPELCSIHGCAKCGCRTWHAPIKYKAAFLAGKHDPPPVLTGQGTSQTEWPKQEKSDG